MWSVSINRGISFEKLLEIQEEQLAFLKSQIKPENKNLLLMAELQPTITLGSRQVHSNAEVSRLENLKIEAPQKGINLVHGHRGGNETWHGPGQWVGFVLTPLVQFTGDPKGVRKAVCGILHNVHDVVKEYIPDAIIEDDDRMGVWSKKGKIVSVGIKIREGYITSGFALNCFPTELSFYGINPCGIGGAVPDFIFPENLPESRWENEFLALPNKLLKSFEINNLTQCSI